SPSLKRAPVIPSSERSVPHPSQVTTWPSSPPPPRDFKRSVPLHAGSCERCTHLSNGKSSRCTSEHTATKGTCDMRGLYCLVACSLSLQITCCRMVNVLSSSRLQYIQKHQRGKRSTGTVSFTFR